MSDVEAETNAFIALVTEADHKLETAYGEIMGGLGQLEALFAAPLAAAPLPAEIDDIAGHFDADIAQIGQLFHDSLALEISNAQKDLAQFDEAVHALVSSWTSQITDTETTLTHLFEKIAEIEARLHDSVADMFVPAMAHAQELLEGAASTLATTGGDWATALHGDLLAGFNQAWQELSDHVAGQHTDTAHSLIAAAHDHAGGSVSHLIEQVTASIGDFGNEAQQALSTLASHVGQDVQDKMTEALHHVAETAVKEMLHMVGHAIEVATIGEMVTTAMASSGVLEILIPLNAAAEAILRAIEIFKNPLSLFSL